MMTEEELENVRENLIVTKRTSPLKEGKLALAALQRAMKNAQKLF